MRSRFEMMMQEIVTEFFSHFRQLTFNRLDGLYLRKMFLLIDNIFKDQLRKQSASEILKNRTEKKSKERK